MLSVRRPRLEETDGAVDVWLAANEARGRHASLARQARVREKVADRAALSVIALDEGMIVGMALAEAGRHHDGNGSLDPLLLHVSMVFVHPAYWDRRVGRALLGELFDQGRLAGYTRTSLWTANDNERARRLYGRLGLRPTGRTKTLASHGLIVQYSARLGA